MSLTNHGHYDLSTDREVGTRFILSIMAMMVFLGLLALSAAFTLLNLNAGWTQDLRGVMTIEIPATDPDGDPRNVQARQAAQNRVIAALQTLPDIVEVTAIPDAEMRERLRPWLGMAVDGGELPLPSLIHLRVSDPGAAQDIAAQLANIQPDARLDRHQAWLDDLGRLTGSLSLLSFILILMILGTIIIAVSGAVRARLASHAEEVDLLHLMGAQDSYITKQFQQAVLSLTLRGAILGMFCAGLVIGGLALLSGRMNLAITDLPPLQWWHWVGLAAFPFAILGLVSLTAKITVLSVLHKMP